MVHSRTTPPGKINLVSLSSRKTDLITRDCKFMCECTGGSKLDHTHTLAHALDLTNIIKEQYRIVP